MKKVIKIIIAVVAIIAISLCCYVEVQSRVAHIEPVEGDPFNELVKIRCTCYCQGTKTATGRKTRWGIAAGKKEWIGYTAELNAINPDGSVGEFIGYFEFQDTGAGMDTNGDGKGDSIINGQSIDIWISSLNEAYAFRDRYGDYVYMKIIKAKG